MSNFILPYKGVIPQIHDSAFIALSASIVGDVKIGEDSSVWYGCVARADEQPIVIGKRSNIQDGSIIHITAATQGTYIGDDVTVGHNAIIHACILEDLSFVGMGACVMDGAVVERGAMLAAGALLTPNKRLPKGELWAGNPAKYMRNLTEKDQAHIKWSATHYVELARDHKAI